MRTLRRKSQKRVYIPVYEGRKLGYIPSSGKHGEIDMSHRFLVLPVGELISCILVDLKLFW